MSKMKNRLEIKAYVDYLVKCLVPTNYQQRLILMKQRKKRLATYRCIYKIVWRIDDEKTK